MRIVARLAAVSDQQYQAREVAGQPQPGQHLTRQLYLTVETTGGVAGKTWTQLFRGRSQSKVIVVLMRLADGEGASDQLDQVVQAGGPRPG